MIGRNGERGSGISALAARHDDDVCLIKINWPEYNFKSVVLGANKINLCMLLLLTIIKSDFKENFNNLLLTHWDMKNLDKI